MEEYDTFEMAQGLYWFCANYHRGQSCPLYRILSQIPYTPGASEHGPDDERAQNFYGHLEDLYRTYHKHINAMSPGFVEMIEYMFGRLMESVEEDKNENYKGE